MIFVITKFSNTARIVVGLPPRKPSRVRIGRGILAALLVIAFAALPASAEPAKLGSLKVGVKTYYKLTILGVSETDLYFKHDGGIANVKLKDLDPEMQARFDYDSKAADAAERRQTEDDSAYHETVALELTARVQKSLKAVAEAAANSEESLADPISSQSLLNRPAPKVEIAKWLGETPAMEGKAVLVFFWTTWSMPCRKAIPELNALQTEFGDQLVVVGLSAQEESDVAEFIDTNSDVKIDFPLAVDPKSKLASVAGVTSVPQTLLIDAKGVVRYVGHPAALNAATLRRLIPKPEE